MKRNSLNPAVAQRVVEHMNADHGDALVLYVQAFGDAIDAVYARMASIDMAAMEVDYWGTDRSGRVRLTFDPPLADPGEIRPRLVAMVQEARDQLADKEPGGHRPQTGSLTSGNRIA